MPVITPAQYHQATKDLSKLTRSQIELLFRSLVQGKPDKDFGRILSQFPDLIDLLGKTSANLAAVFYDSEREMSGLTLAPFIAKPSTSVTMDHILESVRWSALPVLDGNPDDGLARLLGSAQKLVLAPGRDTLIESIQSDTAKVRYERIPSASACGFCLMCCGNPDLLNNPADGELYHKNCNCGTSPVFGDKPPSATTSLLMDAWKSTDPHAPIEERQAALVTAYADYSAA